MPGGREETSTERSLLHEPLEASHARIAARQHGVVALEQLVSLGLSASAVRSRHAVGRLHRVYRGIYAVGHARLTADGHRMAAVLAYGPAAVLSHRSAAALWGLRPDHRDRIDVSLPSPAARSRPGITIHRSTSLVPQETTTVDCIACTTVPRTLLDLAEALSQRDLDRAVAQAEVLRVFDLRAVEATLARAGGRRGARALRRAVTAATWPMLTASELEERFVGFLDFFAAAGFPRPEVNEWLALEGCHVSPDFLWRAEGLVVETDSRRFHDHRHSVEHDHEKDLRLRLAGWRVLRFTWRQVTTDGERVRRAVASELARGWRRPGSGPMVR